MTQRIEPSFRYVWMNWTHLTDYSQNWTLFWTWLKFFFFLTNEYDWQNWIFSLIWLKVLNFFCMTLSVNWTFFFKKYDLTHRIEPLVMNLFSIRLQELNLSSNMAQRIEFLFSISQRIGVFQYDSLKITQRIVFSWLKELIFFIWVKEFNSFFKYDAKNGTLFSLNTTQRIEPFFLWIRRKELNPFFEYDAKNRILFLWIWRKELKALFKMTRRIEPSRKNAQRLEPSFLNLTQRIEPFFECDSKFEIFCLKNSQNIELFPKNYDSKNWTFFSKEWCKVFFLKKIWFEEWNLLENMTFKQKHDSKNWTLFDSENWFF